MSRAIYDKTAAAAGASSINMDTAAHAASDDDFIPAIQQARSNPAAKQGWVQMRDDCTGRAYFANYFDGRTQWQPPPNWRQVLLLPNNNNSQQQFGMLGPPTPLDENETTKTTAPPQEVQAATEHLNENSLENHQDDDHDDVVGAGEEEIDEQDEDASDSHVVGHAAAAPVGDAADADGGDASISATRKPATRESSLKKRKAPSLPMAERNYDNEDEDFELDESDDNESDDENDEDYLPGRPAAKKKPRKNYRKKPPPAGKPDKRKRRKRGMLGFDQILAKLKAYKAEHGHLNVPCRPKKGTTTEELRKLGFQVERIRQHYRLLKRGDPASALILPQLVELTNIGFVFDACSSPNGRVSFEERLEQCRAYKAQHGHLKIPKLDPELGHWCEYIRKNYKHKQEGKKSRLTDEKIAQLEALGFVFRAGKPMPKFVAKTWAQRVEEFKEFKHMHGHPYVPQHLEGGLGAWVSEQRRMYKRMQRGGPRCSMTPEKALELHQAGFAFDASSIRRTPKSALEMGMEKQQQTHQHNDNKHHAYDPYY